jgi:hypothetical protein
VAVATPIQWITTEDGRRIPLGAKNAQAEARGGAREKALKGARTSDTGEAAPGSKVEVQGDEAALGALIQKLGLKGSIEEVARATIPDGLFDRVTIKRDPQNENIVLVAARSGTGAHAARYLQKMPTTGKLICENGSFGLPKEEQGKGTGSTFFAKQVEGLSSIGIQEIRTDATKSPTENGYYTWPRLGYDAPVPSKSASKLPEELKSASNLSDLMRTPEGRSWWKANGTGVALKFDLKEGSYSRKVLDAYMAERENRGLGGDKKPEAPSSVQSKDTSVRYRTLDGGWDKQREQDVHLPLLAKIAHGVPPVETPTLFMTGGGYGSGKSVVVEHTFPKANEAVHVDPDGLKKGIPEFHDLAAKGDAGAATAVHEESSHVAKRAVKENLESDRHVVYDSSGDTGIEKLHGKVQDFRKAGAQRVVANYAFPGSIEEAISRADSRGKAQAAKERHRDSFPTRFYEKIITTFPLRGKQRRKGVHSTS